MLSPIQNQSDGHLYVGMRIVVNGLNMERRFNGLKGELLEFCPDISRWYVRVWATPTIVLRIKPENLKIDENIYRESHGSVRRYLDWRKSVQSACFARFGTVCQSDSSQNLSPRSLDNTWESLPEAGILKISFGQLQNLWVKYGERYTTWFESLSQRKAVEVLSQSKHRYLNSLNISGQGVSKHVPSPSGIAACKNCLLPELQTRGPCLEGLSKEEVLEETQAVSGWLAFLRSRTDPASLYNDVIHSQSLYDIGVQIPVRGSEKPLGNRLFCVACRADTVMDPMNLPGRIFLLPSDHTSSDETISPAQGQKAHKATVNMAGLTIVEWPNAEVYKMSLLRMEYLTTFIFVTISDYCKEFENRNGEDLLLCSMCGKTAFDLDPGVKMKRCSRCRFTRYCSSEHQRADWDRHKLVCCPVNTREDQRSSATSAAAFQQM